ncbi:DUF4224 domain-containing protein [Variovorax sp. AFSI2.2]|uniref:DUF4224 domain-containing protein n=1 Tax=Variovorax sp. AFSI2.2 TaxID=3384160 RepID=UPI003EC036B0
MTTAETPLASSAEAQQASAILTRAELKQLTGYKRSAEQMAELLRQGFYRARRSRVDGSVILERPHYDAVSAGASMPANEPRLRPVTRKRA